MDFIQPTFVRCCTSIPLERPIVRASQVAPAAEKENRLLAGLPKSDRLRLFARAKLVTLDANLVLVSEGQESRYIYFPVDCTIGIFSPTEMTAPMAVSIVGYEGMVGGVMLLGSGLLPGAAVVLDAGTAWRISRKALEVLVNEPGAVRRRLFLYLHLAFINLAQQAVCGHFHSIESRLARWLLLIHDRVGSDQFALTHKMLADLLGVQRVGVTIAASALQTRDLIEYRRGVISLIDRKGLVETACNCYGVDERNYLKVLDKAGAV